MSSSLETEMDFRLSIKLPNLRRDSISRFGELDLLVESRNVVKDNLFYSYASSQLKVVVNLLQ